MEFDEELGYREMQERARAGADVMGTEIEGRGVLARAQQKLERRVGSAADRKLLAFFRELTPLYKRFAPNDEVLALEEFNRLPNAKYKNPYAFLLAYIAAREGLTRESLAVLKGFVDAAQVSNVSEEDIIRYYRLLMKQQGQQFY